MAQTKSNLRPLHLFIYSIAKFTLRSLLPCKESVIVLGRCQLGLHGWQKTEASETLGGR